MEIKVGNSYVTRDGRKAEVLSSNKMGFVGKIGEMSVTWNEWGYYSSSSDTSRLDLISEWLTTWSEISDQEKGEMLLAHHNGKEIEMYNFGEWVTVEPQWVSNRAYRIKKEPVVKQVTLYGEIESPPEYQHPTIYLGKEKMGRDTHTITYNVIDGKIDCSSVVMKEL